MALLYRCLMEVRALTDQAGLPPQLDRDAWHGCRVPHAARGASGRSPAGLVPFASAPAGRRPAARWAATSARPPAESLPHAFRTPE